MHGRFHRLVFSSATLAAIILAAGCSGGADQGGGFPDPATAEPAAPEPLAVNSEDACALDVDCVAGRFCFQGTCAFACSDRDDCGSGERCDSRGRCTSAPIPGTGALTARQPLEDRHADALPGLRIVGAPKTVFHVQPDQQTVNVELTLNTAPPKRGVSYLIDRSDQPDAQPTVRRMNADSQVVSFQLDVGAASPGSEDPKTVRVSMTSAVGSLTFALIPERPAGGAYSGIVKISTFGSSGVPIEFTVVTRPQGATLSQAEEAYLVLPVAESKVFAPTRGESAPDRVAAPLEFDDFTETHVANFRGAFDLTDGVVINSPTVDQVERKMRFELQIDDEGRLLGNLRDTWTGLYEARSSKGVMSLADVTYRGALTMTRSGEGLPFDTIDTSPSVPEANPTSLPPPEPSACGSVDFDMPPVNYEDTAYACGSITDLSEFEAAGADDQARCAIAIAQRGLEGETTAEQIRAFINGDDVGGLSFADFMAECAEGKNGRCRPSDRVACGRQLVSIAYRDDNLSPGLLSPVLSTYLDASREVFLGEQFGSLQSDTETRLEWLKSANYPAVITSAVRSLTEGLLDDWQSQVLDVHFSVLAGQFDNAGLTALAREPEGQRATETRGELLLEMNQSFRTAVDSLTLATQRWDTLYVDASSRRQKAAYVSTRARDLYLAAGILKNLNLAGGTGYLSASLGAGFGALLAELSRLSLNFNQLIYARDAEVVVSTSVDPTVSNQTLLADLEADARTAVDDASETVGNVVAQDQAEALNSEQLTNRLNNEIDDLKSDLVTMCGMPLGCSISEVFSDDACRVRVEAGQCGFVYDKDQEELSRDFQFSDLSTSEAGKRLIALLEAAQEVKIARNEIDELHKRLKIRHRQTDAFAKSLGRRAQLRQQKLGAMVSAFEQIARSRDDQIAEFARNIARRKSKRADIIADSRASLETWDTIRFGSITTQMGLEISSLAAGRTAAGLEASAEGVLNAADAFKDGLPTGKEDIPSAATRLAIGTGAVNSAAAITASAQTFQGISDSLALASDQVGRYSEATLTSLEAASDIGTQEDLDEVTALREQARLARYESQAERDAIRNALALVKEEKAIALAAESESQQLLDRRSALLEELTKVVGLQLGVAKARMTYQRRLADYANTVQRAQLIDAKLDDLVQQRANINLIVGSPSAVFSRANRISRAEAKLELAKDRMMDWLVALEYYAVRPFMDQRIQVLLARNPYQLEKIADKLAQLQGSCGGQTNSFTAELSVRKDLLTLTQPQVSMQDNPLPPEQIFRDLLDGGYVPIDKRVRYTTDQNVGDLLSASNNLMAATFSLNLTDFANLAATCNAKVESVDIQLVGEVGEGRPTVSLLYDGTSELRSCQPGIDEYVAQFGPETTAFGSVTYLRTPGRSISPVAGVNQFIEESANTTLSGLPLSSQYTLLIDKQAGENKSIEWSKLEDVRLRVTYSYQDVFPEGQCQ